MRKAHRLKRAIAARVLVEKTPSSKALTRNEKRAAAQLIAGAKDGDVPDMTETEAGKVAELPHVRDVIVEAMTMLGVTPAKLAECLTEGLKADHTQYFASFGRVLDQRTSPDHGMRHKFLETALRIIGAGARATESSPPAANVFVFRSHLGERPIDTQVGAPQDAVVKRRLRAAKVGNRPYA